MLFQKKIDKYEKEGRPIVYVDESGFTHDMPRTHGYARRGSRCFGNHDWNAKGRKNVIAGLFGSSLIGCGIVEANVDTAAFNTWIEKILIPDLPKNSVVVMDNASFHKSQQTKKLIQNNGHDLQYLPPYSPDLNPIEHKWAQAKSIRRKLSCDTLELFQYHFT